MAKVVRGTGKIQTRMSRPLPNTILASGTVTITLSLARAMDKGDAKRTKFYTFPLDFTSQGSKQLHSLPNELHRLGGQVVAKIASWESRATEH